MVDGKDPELEKLRDAIREAVKEVSCQHAELTSSQLEDIIYVRTQPKFPRSFVWSRVSIVALARISITEGRVEGRIEGGDRSRPAKFYFDMDANRRRFAGAR